MRSNLSVMIIMISSAMAVHSAGPPKDCLDTLMKLSSCMQFVMLGSNATTPESTCCDGLKTIIKTDDESGTQNGTNCLCDAFNNGGSSYGVRVNHTKSIALPDACQVNSPDTNCTDRVVPRASAPAPSSNPLDAPPTPSTPGARSAAGRARASGWVAAFVPTAAALLFIYS